jgi:hypothetical protein
MTLPVRTISVDQPYANRLRRLTWLGVVALLVGGCASYSSLAHDQFGAKYSCLSDQVTVGPPAEMPSNYTVIDATGCGYETKYRCFHSAGLGRADESRCEEENRLSYEGTDGSPHPTWENDPSVGHTDEPARKAAALASAAHDLPCEPGSIVAVGNDVLEGCGQRVSYRVVDYAIAPVPGRVQPVKGRRYTLVGRIPISGATAIPSAPPPSPAPTAR